MFPDSSITKSYQMPSTKLIYDVKNTPTLREKCPYSELFLSAYSGRMGGNADQNNSEYGHFLRSAYTFKFNETTNRQVQKQYDGYLQYWSNESNEIVNSHCGSLFI